MKKLTLFDYYENEWQKEWKDMPEFINVSKEKPYIIVNLKFRNQEDFDIFHKLLKEHIYKTDKIFDGMQKKFEKTAWYPLNEKSNNLIYIDES